MSELADLVHNRLRIQPLLYSEDRMNDPVSVVLPVQGMVSPETIRGCLNSLKQHTPRQYRLIVVAEQLDAEMRKYLASVGCILLERPGGSSWPTLLNVGVGRSRTAQCVLIHPTTKFKGPWLNKALSTLHTGARAAVSMGYLPSRMEKGKHTLSYLSYGCLVVHRKVCESLPFDERYSSPYYTAVDWTQRVERLGYRLTEVHKLPVDVEHLDSSPPEDGEKINSSYRASGLKVVVIRLHALGDVLNAVAATAGLRFSHPGSTVAFWTDPSRRPLIEGSPYVDLCALGYTEKERAKLKAFAPDFVCNLQDYDEGWQWAESLGCGGVKGKRHPLMLQALESRRQRGALGIHMTNVMGEILGTTPFQSYIPLSEQDYNWARSYLRGAGVKEREPVIAVHPWGSSWVGKNWMPAFTHSVVKGLSQHAKILLVGLGEKPSMSIPCLDGYNHPVRQLAALLDFARLYVGIDAGPAHMAAALGLPCVVTYGPTNFANDHPYHVPTVGISSKVDCRPCYSDKCLTGTLDCVKKLNVADVVEQALFLLGSEGSR